MFPRWALRFVGVAFAAPPLGPAPAGDFLESLFAQQPPQSPSSGGWDGHLQRRFKLRVITVGAAYADAVDHFHGVSRGARRYAVAAEDREPLSKQLPHFYAGEAEKLRQKLTGARRTIADAGFGLERLSGQAERLRYSLAGDLAWLVCCPWWFYEASRTEGIIDEAHELLADSEEALSSLDNRPRLVAEELRQLVKLLEAHESEAAAVAALQVVGPELEQEQTSSAQVRRMFEALPAPLWADDESTLGLPPRLVAAAHTAIVGARQRLDPGLQRLRGWRELLLTLDARLGALKVLMRMTAQRRAALEALRGAPVLTEAFSGRQRSAGALIERRGQLTLGALPGLADTAGRAVAYYTRLQENLEATTSATEQIIRIAPRLSERVGKLQRLIRQGEAGSFPIAWTRSREQVEQLERQAQRMAVFPPLADLRDVEQELEAALDAEHEAQQRSEDLAETMGLRERLRELQGDPLLQRERSWQSDMRGLKEAIGRYGRANWPKGLLIRVDQGAENFARRIAAVPQPGAPLAEEQIEGAVGRLERLLVEIGEFDARVLAIRKELRRLDDYALDASRRLEHVQALLDKALAVAPTQPSLKLLHRRVLEQQQQLQPRIKARVAELAQHTIALELQSAQSCRDLARRLRTSYEEACRQSHALVSAIYGRASLQQDVELHALVERAGRLPSLPVAPGHERSFAEAVEDVQLLAVLFGEASAVSAGLRASAELLDRWWRDVSKEAELGHEQLRELGQSAEEWPPVAIDAAHVERLLQRSDEQAAQLMGCRSVRDYESRARRVCEEYRGCRQQLQLQRGELQQRRDHLLALEYWIQQQLDDRWNHSVLPTTTQAQRSRAVWFVTATREQLGEIRNRFTDPIRPASPHLLERELQRLVEAIQQEQRMHPLLMPVEL